MIHLIRTRPTLFDAYLFVDWSAARTRGQGRDSIWIADAYFGPDGGLLWQHNGPWNPPSRSAAYTSVLGRLRDHMAQERRVLVGFDFPYGYPRGTVGMIIDLPEVGQAEWRALWRHLTQVIEDDLGGRDNDNNRFAVANTLNQRRPGWTGPYWGRPANLMHLQTLAATKPNCFADGVVREYRTIEQRMRLNNLQPKSVWQLYGNGSVGSQSLMGLPYLQRLTTLEGLQSVSKVWPFETGWICPGRNQGTQIVHAEIWPGAITVDRQLHEVLDAAQMMSYLLWAANQDVSGTFADQFDPLAQCGGAELAEQAIEEGWILGFMR